MRGLYVAIRERIQTNRELREELRLVTEQRDLLAKGLDQMEDDALLALQMALAQGDPEGCFWTRDAERLWAEVRGS